MAKVSICDYCKKINRDDLEDSIRLESSGNHCYDFELCEDCFESLRTQLQSDAPLPQAVKNTRSELGSRDSLPMRWPQNQPHPLLGSIHSATGQPTEALLDNEIHVVPTRRDEIVREDKSCKHKYDMTKSPMGDMYMACVNCKEKMGTESFD